MQTFPGLARSLLPLCIVLLLGSGCNDHQEFLRLDEDILSFNFSENSRQLLISSVRYDPQDPWTSIGGAKTIRVFDLESMKVTHTFHYPHGMVSRPVYSCADPNVIAFGLSEAEVPEGPYTPMKLTFIDLSTERVIAELPTELLLQSVRKKHTWYPFPDGDFLCNLEKNTMYLAALKDRVQAVDGSTGAVKTEYLIAEPGNEVYRLVFPFEQVDRLVVANTSNSDFRVFRLSTGEFLGTVTLPSQLLGQGMGDMVRVDADKLVLEYTVKVSQSTYDAHLLVVDVDDLRVVDDFTLSGKHVYMHFAMEYGKLLVVLAEGDDICGSIVRFDWRTGEAETVFDVCSVLLTGPIAPVLDAGRVYIQPYEALGPSTYNARFYSWPDFTLIGEVPKSSGYYALAYIPERKRFVFEDLAINGLAFVDPVAAKETGDLSGVCRRVNEGSLIVDPAGRYAAVECTRNSPASMEDPTGAGISVVKLDGYLPNDP